MTRNYIELWRHGSASYQILLILHPQVFLVKGTHFIHGLPGC